MRVDVESYGISDVGLVRSNNEDAWAEIPGNQFYILADGMGGHKAGEVASSETVKRLAAEIEKLSSSTASVRTKMKQLGQAIAKVNEEVYLLSTRSAHYNGMGTTLACIWVAQEKLIFAHVGDSRIYQFRKNRLHLLTHDHTTRQEMLYRPAADLGPIVISKNVLTRAVGTQFTVEPDIESLRVADGDIYFICSDGLTDDLSLQELEKILQDSKTIKQASDNLIRAAKAKGGNDNITVLMLKIILQ